MKLPAKIRIHPDKVVFLKQVAKSVVVIGAVALLLYAIWYGTRLPVVTIDSVIVEGGETINHERVKAMVERELEGEYLGFIPKHFAYLYPQNSIQESVTQIDRVHSVQVERVGRHEVRVTFDEYEPFALWCNDIESNECFFLNRDGYAFSRSPQLQGGSFVRFVHLNESPEAGRTLTQTEDFATIIRLIELFAENGWNISQVELDRVGDAFLYVVDGGELKVALSASPEETVENLLVVLTSEEFQHIEPGNFAYIDLRFGSKVFVKEEELIPEVEVASSTETGGEIENGAELMDVE